MTTSALKLIDEFSPTGPSSSVSEESAQIHYFEFSLPRREPLKNTKSVSELIRQAESNPARAAALNAARKKLSAAMYVDEQDTFSAIRLAAGLSQTQLSELSGCSQPHINRIEGGRQDPSTDVIARLAAALNVSPARVFVAIRNQLNTRGKKK